MNIGKWNLKGITGKMNEIIKENKKMYKDIITLTETKRNGNVTEIKDEYLHVVNGAPKSDRTRGVFIIIHKRHKQKITNFQAIEENLIKFYMTIRDQLLFLA